jgi:hypothetical protein
MDSNLDFYPQKNEIVISRVVNGEAVLVIPQEGQVKVLNEVGSRIWSLADGTRTIRQIAQSICEEYDVEQVQSENDVLAFIEQLLEKKLVSLADNPDYK